MKATKVKNNAATIFKESWRIMSALGEGGVLEFLLPGRLPIKERKFNVTTM